jgi:hypothetical protein
MRKAGCDNTARRSKAPYYVLYVSRIQYMYFAAPERVLSLAAVWRAVAIHRRRSAPESLGRHSAPHHPHPCAAPGRDVSTLLAFQCGPTHKAHQSGQTADGGRERPSAGRPQTADPGGAAFAPHRHGHAPSRAQTTQHNKFWATVHCVLYRAYKSNRHSYVYVYNVCVCMLFMYVCCTLLLSHTHTLAQGPPADRGAQAGGRA